MTSLQFGLIETDLDALKSHEDLASGPSDSFIVINAGNGIVDSISNTELMAIPLDMAVQVSPYIPDMTSPVIEGFDINFNSRFGELTLYFSEPILLESLNFVSVTIEITTLNLTYTLTGGTVAGTSFRTVTMFLTFVDITMIKHFKALAADDNIVLSTLADFVRDTANNTSDEMSNVSAFNITIDTTPIRLVYFILDMNIGEIVMEFDDAINISSVLLNSVLLFNNQFEFYLSTLSNFWSYSGFSLIVQISTAELNRLKHIRSLTIGVDDMTFVAVAQSFVRDAFGNNFVPVTRSDAFPVTFFRDTQPPRMTEFIIDLNEELLALYFSEVVDVFTFNISGGVNHSGYQFFSSTEIYPYVIADNIFVLLSNNDINALKQLGGLENIINGIYLSIDVLDTSGNQIIPFSLQNDIVTILPDNTAPRLEMYSLYVDFGQLRLTFTEAVNASSILEAGLTLFNRPSFSFSSYQITDAVYSISLQDVIDVYLTRFATNFIKASTDLATGAFNTFLQLSYCAVRDLNDNCILENTPLQVTHHFSDNIQPSFQSFSLNLSSNILSLEFTEEVKIGSLDPTHITLHNSSNMSESSYTLTGGASLSGPFNDGLVRLLLSHIDSANIKSKEYLATSEANTYISLTENTISDIAGNPVLPHHLSDFNRVSTFTGDTAPPMLLRFDIQISQGILSLTFDEPVVAASFDVTRIAVQDKQSNPNITWTLTGGYLSNENGVVMNITLTNSDLDQIRSILVSQSTLFITLNNNAVVDLNGSSNVPVSSETALEITFNYNPLVLSYFTIDMTRQILVLNFSESVNRSSLDIIHLTIQNSNAFPTELHTLQGAVAFLNENGRAMTVYFTVRDFNAIQSQTRLATQANNSFLSASELLIRSNITGDTLTQINANNAIQSSSYYPDTIVPRVLLFQFDCNNGILTLYFDEVINASTVNSTAIMLYNTTAPSRSTYTLSHSYVLHNATYNEYVSIQLNSIDFNHLKILQICVLDGGQCLIFVSSYLVQDTSSNYNEEVDFDGFQAARFINDSTKPCLTNFRLLDLNIGRFTLEFSEPIVVNTINSSQIGLYSNTNDSSFGIDIQNLSVASTNNLSYVFQINSVDLNNIKRSTNLCTSREPLNCYIRFEDVFATDIAGNRIETVASYPVLPSHLLQEIILDITGPLLQSFSVDMRYGLLVFTFDEVMQIFDINTTLVTLQNSPSPASISYTPRKPGSVELSMDGLEIHWLLDAEDLILIKAQQNLYTGIDTGYLTYANFIADISKNYISPVVGIQTVNYYHDHMHPTLVSFLSLNFDNGSLSLLFDEPIFNIVPQEFALYEVEMLHPTDSLTIVTEIQLTGGTYTYLNEQKIGFVLEFNQIDLKSIRVNQVNGSAVYLAFSTTALTDFSPTSVVPVSRVFPIEFIPDTSSPVFLYSTLDMNTGNLTIEFDDVINSSTINPNLIIISNGLESYYTLSAVYPRNSFESDFRVYISIELSDLNAIKLNNQLATESSNSFIMFSEDLAVDLDGRSVVGMPTQNPTLVSTYIRDATAPLLVSFTLDLNEAMLTFTFNEPIWYSSYFPPGFIFQNAMIQTGNEDSHILTGGIIDRVGNGEGSLIINIALSRLDLSGLQLLKNKTNLNSFFARLLPSAITDVSGNPTAETVLLVSNLTVDMTAPILQSFDLNLNDSLLTLRFSEAVVPQSFTAVKVTLLSRPRISVSTVQLRIDHNSVFYTSEFDSTLHVVLTRNDHDFLIDSSRPIAKSSSSTFITIEAGTVRNYAGLPSQSLPEPLPVTNYFEGEGKLLLIYLCALLCGLYALYTFSLKFLALL